MFPTPVKNFVHPHSAYRLEYPAHWDSVVEKDGEACGFGPHDRDKIGLWISILPMSVDTDKIPEDLPRLMEQTLDKTGATNLRKDSTLKHYALMADMTADNQGGNYWIVTGGDLVLFASTQVPQAERDEWNPHFFKLMASLQITRDDALFMRKIANEVLHQLKKKHPEQEFEFEDENIRGKNQVVYLSNLYREVKASPRRRDAIIKRFVETLTAPVTANLGSETWEEVQTCIVPVLKPRDYFRAEGPTKNLLTTEWLADVLICYAINRDKMFRFVTGHDLERWETTVEVLHELSLRNLSKLPWPKEIAGAREPGSGRIMIIDTNDSLSSSRLLHPDLHRLFSGPLGSPFWAGIPCRNTLVLYSDRHKLRQRIPKQLRKDHKASAYSITPRPFLVTRDGIAPSQPKKGEEEAMKGEEEAMKGEEEVENGDDEK